jgi:hypothetical protein
MHRRASVCHIRMFDRCSLGSRMLITTASQRGQAIVEFLVASLVLIPLFLLIPVIGKYLDMKQATIAASRKLAFECTVRYQDCDNLSGNTSFADEIRMRFYAGDTSPVLTNDRPGQDAVGQDGNPLWVDRQGRPLLENYSDVGVTTDPSNIQVGGDLVNALLSAGPALFGLQIESGLFDARVQVAVAPRNGGSSFVDQLDSLAVNMQFHTAILTNAWNADGPGGKGDRCEPDRNTVAGRVSQVSLCLPQYRAADLTYLPAYLVLQPLTSLPGLAESNAGQFNFHDFIDAGWVDQVPVSDSVGFPRLQ